VRVWLLVLAGCGRIGFDTSDVPTGGYTRANLMLAAPGIELDDFPVPVFLSHFDAAALGDYSSLRFRDGGSRVLPHELERGPSGDLVWVRVPKIPATGTTITIRLDGATGGDNVTDSVWSDDFAAVWHFATAGTATDSSVNLRDAVAIGTASAPGVLGLGRSLRSAAGDYLVATNTSNIIPTGFTVSGWLSLKTAKAGGAFSGMLTRQVGDISDNDIYLGVTGANAVMTCEIATTEVDAIGAAVTVGQFVYLTGVADGTSATIYIDGTMSGSTPTNNPLISNARPLFIGGDRGDGSTSPAVPTGDFLDGTVDELRLQTVARPQPWIAYDLAAQRDQVITYGPVVAVP
jgi:concanavalin A-like lectin/glucanase superfamily protein